MSAAFFRRRFGQSITRRLRAQGGYTLLEMTVVLAILAVFLAVLVPSINRLYQHEELDAAARSVAVQIRLSQMTAFVDQDVTEIWFGNFQPGYSFWENGQKQGQVQLPGRIGYRGGYLTLSTNRMQLNPDGTVNGSGVIRLVNQNREEADVQVGVAAGVIVYGGVYQP